MRIFLVNTKGQKYPIDVPTYCTIKELNDKYCKIIGNYSSFLYKLSGEILKYDKTLEYYDAEEDDCIITCPSSPIKIQNSFFSTNIHVVDKRGNINKEYGFKIKGSNEGTVWGDKIYSDDSNIAKAAVLEGLCQLGEEKTVFIRILEGKSSYSSCNKNGISSRSYGYWHGSYIFI